MEINGKHYPLWGQFVEKQNDWVGGILEDKGDSFDRSIGIPTLTTEITGIDLHPNGSESAFFSIRGKDFDCGFDVKYGGISGGEEGWLTFNGYGGHSFRIRQK